MGMGPENAGRFSGPPKLFCIKTHRILRDCAHAAESNLPRMAKGLPLSPRTLFFCFLGAFPLAVFWRHLLVPLILHAKAHAPKNPVEALDWFCGWTGLSKTSFTEVLSLLESAIVWTAVNVNIWVLVVVLVVICVGVELGCGNKRRGGGRGGAAAGGSTGDAELDKELAEIHKDLDSLMAELKDV